MTDTTIATSADRLTLYRSNHRIFLVEEQHPDFGRIYRCGTDGLRVHATRNARWYHDPAELKVLLDDTYGGPWGGPKEAAIERIASLYDPSEDDESEFLDDRESQPEWNGAFR